MTSNQGSGKMPEEKETARVRNDKRGEKNLTPAWAPTLIEAYANQNLSPPPPPSQHVGNVIETETVEPYLGTETKKSELEPCVVPKVGSDCYKVIQWAMKDPRSVCDGWVDYNTLLWEVGWWVMVG